MKMDDPLETKLKQALARTDPPQGFAGRVMARVARGEAPRPEPSHWPLFGRLFAPAWRTALAGALACLLLLTVGLAYREHRLRLKAEAERARAEQAREELILALRITGVQLSRARNIVLRQMDFRNQQENVRQ
jgi:ABC-type xylose transport system permease subunit